MNLGVSQESIRAKLAELRELAEKANVDIKSEIEEVERKFASPVGSQGEAWKRVQLARHPERPTTLEYAKRIFDDFIELHGDRAFADDAAMVGGIGLLGGVPVTFFGNQKGKNMKDNLKRNFGMAHPEGYRKALRLAKQAEKFGRPVLTFIDSPGAHPGVSAEERGISQSIAVNMKEFSVLRVPIVTTILGEGCSGGAIGIGLGDLILMMENAYYTVITPEGCASILLRDAGKAPASAALLKLTPEDMIEFKVVDRIIKEPDGGAQKNPEAAAASVKAAIQEGLADISKKTIEALIADRQEKFLSLGVFQEGEPQKRGFLKRLRDFF